MDITRGRISFFFLSQRESEIWLIGRLVNILFRINFYFLGRIHYQVQLSIFFRQLSLLHWRMRTKTIHEPELMPSSQVRFRAAFVGKQLVSLPFFSIARRPTSLRIQGLRLFFYPIIPSFKLRGIQRI